METTEYSLLFIVIESHAVSQTRELQGTIVWSFVVIIIIIIVVIITIIMFSFLFTRCQSLAFCQVLTQINS